jgi:hypothetical protein
VQIDLVDMCHEADEVFKWILHIKDHFSKYSCLYPLRSKHSADVTECMALWIECFGIPKILQCDNGTEFKGVLLLLLEKHGIKIKNGWPRNPRTQGLVEQVNGVMKAKLRAWKDETGRTTWSTALPDIALAMNCQRAVTISTGRNARSIGSIY